jgi:hypothetical protein
MQMYRTAAVVLLVAQTGCAATAVMREPRSELAATQSGRTIVTQSDGARVLLSGARVRADTIFGMDSRGRFYSLALRHAETIEVRKFSLARTAILGAGLVVGMTMLVVMSGGGSGPVQFVFTDCDKWQDSTACRPTMKLFSKVLH